MWRRTSVSRGAWLCLLIAAACVVGGSSPSSLMQPEIDELHWVHPDADPVRALTMRPAECFRPPSEEGAQQLALLGRVAFRSPHSLGGVAARVGLRCDSCHPNGHANPDFHFAGASGSAGTVDVTGSVFSTTREDHVENPVPIPSLVGVAERSRFGTMRPHRDLASFVKAVIVEEFEGRPPAPRLVAGLVVYLESLRVDACPPDPVIPWTLERAARDVRDAFDVARAALATGRNSEAAFAVLAARAALGRIHQRFPVQIEARDALVDLAAFLGPREGGRPEAPTGLSVSKLAAGEAEFDEVMRRLAPFEDRSYFDPKTLGDALGPSVAERRPGREARVGRDAPSPR